MCPRVPPRMVCRIRESLGSGFGVSLRRGPRPPFNFHVNVELKRIIKKVGQYLVPLLKNKVKYDRVRVAAVSLPALWLCTQPRAFNLTPSRAISLAVRVGTYQLTLPARASTYAQRFGRLGTPSFWPSNHHKRTGDRMVLRRATWGWRSRRCTSSGHRWSTQEPPGGRCQTARRRATSR